MLFDPRPKKSRSELFNRVEEIAALELSARGGSPLILCLDVRMIGKTFNIKSISQ